MKKVIYFRSVSGLKGLFYDLFHQDKELHKDIMLELNRLGFLFNISEDFSGEDDINWAKDSPGFFVTGKSEVYSLPYNYLDLNKLRASDKFHKICEEFNNKLIRKCDIAYRDVKEDRFESLYIMEYEDGSEKILFVD